MLRKLRRLADVSPSEWLLLPQLALCALVVGIALRITTLPRLTGFIGRCAKNRRLRHFPFFHAQHQLTRLAILKETAALHGHAWIETQGQVVSDSPAMAGRFVTLLRF